MRKCRGPFASHTPLGLLGQNGSGRGNAGEVDLAGVSVEAEAGRNLYRRRKCEEQRLLGGVGRGEGVVMRCHGPIMTRGCYEVAGTTISGEAEDAGEP